MKKTTAKNNNTKNSKQTKAQKKPTPAPKKAAPKKVAPKPPVKKAPAKKTAPKKPETKKVAPKKTETKKPEQKKEFKNEKKCKANPQKPCCGKKDCDCKNQGKKLIAEIFGQLNQINAIEDLLKDYFFTELLKRGTDEIIATQAANNLIITVEGLEATIDTH